MTRFWSLRRALMLRVYSFLTSVFSLLVLPFIFILRLIQKKDISSWKTKMGCFNLWESFDKNKKTIMVHGVSVGEVVSLEKLIRKIKENFPNHNLIITTGTKTGQETAFKKMSDVASFITYFPLDVPVFVKKFLDKINPDVVLMAETEIWPVFAYNCSKRNIPVFIINGRISDNSYKSYKFLCPFFKAVLPLYKGIFTQSEIDKERFKTLGAPKNSLEIMRNLKFDIEKSEADINLGENKVLIAGSTHAGEDEIVLNVFKKLNSKDKEIKLLLAPRHLTRLEDVKKLLEKNDLSFNCYSNTKGFEGANVLLLDVMGELAKLYSASKVAFIGGSFNNTGGHNPLEASIFNKPVISGPSIKNFRDIYAILTRDNAGFVVNSEDEFYEIAEKLFFDDEFYNQASSCAEKVFNNQKGALEFVTRKLKEVV